MQEEGLDIAAEFRATLGGSGGVPFNLSLSLACGKQPSVFLESVFVSTQHSLIGFVLHSSPALGCAAADSL